MIDIAHVYKSYSRGHDCFVHALRGISFHVAASEFLAIRGASGSGKSTLLNILGCLDVPTSGTYRLAGEDVSHCTDRELSSGTRAPHWIHLPVFQPAAGDDGAGKCRVAYDLRCRPRGPEQSSVAARTCSVSRTAPAISPMNCREDNSSAWPSRGRW